MSQRSNGFRAILVLAAGLCVMGAPASWSSPPTGLSQVQKQASAYGLQTTPKGAAARALSAGPNPFLANLPSSNGVDFSTWRQRLASLGKQRAASTQLAANRNRVSGRSVDGVFDYTEREPADRSGRNDRLRKAERIRGFGTGGKEIPRVRIRGSLSDQTAAPRDLPVIEDNGSIPLATATQIDGVGTVRISSTLGDVYGGADGSNDFDFFAVEGRAGLSITVDLLGTAPPLDTVAVIYDADGDIVALNDDAFVGPNFLASRLSYPVAKSGRYYVLIAGFSFLGPLPADPSDPGSGVGGADQGDYVATISSSLVDADFFAVHLDKGDVIGAVTNGTADSLTVYRPDGAQMVGASRVDASALYPPDSPLPGGGNTTLAYVAEGAGIYAIRVDGRSGAYEALVEVYRPGTETDLSARVQTIFLDFDGAQVDTGIFGGPGVRELSPFADFLAGWGLDHQQEGVLIDRITATVRENVQRDLAARGLNDKLSVRVINSRNARDPFGQTNVSRVIIGGSIEESGIGVIGTAQYIDPGNYGHEDSALVLLDVLSGTPEYGGPASLNSYLKASSDRVGFVSRAVGNVASHEIGHYLGSYHTDSSDVVHTLMDAGGSNFGINLYGVGPDGLGGTKDDEDIDFREDRYYLFEGFTGLENTLNVSAWALVRGAGVRP